MLKFKYMDPQMAVVISLIILGIGVFAFFTVLEQINDQNQAMHSSSAADWSASNNTSRNLSTTGNSVFNIVGIVLIIGAIMTIVGLVYAYVRR